MVTNLDFLVDRFNALDGVDGDAGDNCFREELPILLQESMVKRGRGGREESTLRFFAWTEIPENEYMPLYQLNLFGDTVPSEDWFPSSGSSTTMTMTDWKLQLEAEGQDVKNISCLGEFVMGDDFEVKITVTRTN